MLSGDGSRNHAQSSCQCALLVLTGKWNQTNNSLVAVPGTVQKVAYRWCLLKDHRADSVLLGGERCTSSGSTETPPRQSALSRMAVQHLVGCSIWWAATTCLSNCLVPPRRKTSCSRMYRFVNSHILGSALRSWAEHSTKQSTMSPYPSRFISLSN